MTSLIVAAAATAAGARFSLSEPATMRSVFSLDAGWKFELEGSGPLTPCAAGTWTQDASNVEVSGLHEAQATSEEVCAEACCNDPTCQVYQFCNTSACGNGPPQQPACWIGVGQWPKTSPSPGWVGKARPQPAPPACPTGVWTTNLTNRKTAGLSHVSTASSADECARACCDSDSCETFQFCNAAPCDNVGCWIGAYVPQKTTEQDGWVGSARPKPSPGGSCSDPWCDPKTDDSHWRTVRVPHDFVVEGNFSAQADKVHGYLPYGIGFYRKHLSMTSVDSSSFTYFLAFDGAQTASSVYLGGQFIGSHTSGYTPFHFQLSDAQADQLAGSNGGAVLAVRTDATQPDGWWYDGGGLYRHVWLKAVPKVHIAISGGAYTPAIVTGHISGSSAKNNLVADAQVYPSVAVVNSGNSSATNILVQCRFESPDGKPVGNSSSTVSTLAAGANSTVSLPVVDLPAAHLWHPSVDNPALYSATCSAAAQGSSSFDSTQHFFGVRQPTWDVDTGFSLNGESVKILGAANHQDFAGLGVAVPDVLQAHRIAKLQDMGCNAWRTAHNAPTEALLDAADRLGFLVWDENHRNGQDDELTRLVHRDRNHPSIIIWSICNEKLCTTSDTMGDAIRLHDLFHELDPKGERVVSANFNGWLKSPAGKPLDVQGVDYATGSYDSNHQNNPVPLISSETSSAVSDRAIYANNETTGHVRGYDTEHPSWGQTAEGAWGGQGEPNGQGILTRPFIAGGFTWTGWDYKGEPTPYQWPDINSHFGILDEAGFPKDRFYWYKSWFVPYAESDGIVHLLPHWNWEPNAPIDVWAFSNGASVELFVNNKSQGRKNQTQFSHVEWDSIPFTAGSISAVAYNAKGAEVATDTVVTSGPPVALKASIKDGVGANGQLAAGCSDVALVQVELVDASGQLVRVGSNNVTFSISGSGPVKYLGGGNGDPAEHTPDKSAERPAFGGLVLGVFGVDLDSAAPTGSVTVTASSPGLKSSTLDLTVSQPKEQPWWCNRAQEL